METDKEFFTSERGSMSRADFDADVHRFAGGLLAAGLHEGDSVALLMRNDTPLAQAMIGADPAEEILICNV